MLNGIFFRTTWLRRYQEGKIIRDINEAGDDGVLEWQWHQPGNMQTICISLQTDNHANTVSLNSTDQMLVLMPNQYCKSTECTIWRPKQK